MDSVPYKLERSKQATGLIKEMIYIKRRKSKVQQPVALGNMCTLADL